MDRASECPLLMHTDPSPEGLAGPETPARAWKGCLGPQHGALSETEELAFLGGQDMASLPDPPETPSQWVPPGPQGPGTFGSEDVSSMAHWPPFLCLVPRDV